MCVYPSLSDEHQRILQALFETPPRPDISWLDASSLLRALPDYQDVQFDESDSRICLAVLYQGEFKIGLFPRPVHQDCLSQFMVERTRSFLMSVGITPSHR
jgi:hypothetical protein